MGFSVLDREGGLRPLAEVSIDFAPFGRSFSASLVNIHVIWRFLYSLLVPYAEIRIVAEAAVFNASDLTKSTIKGGMELFL